MHLAACFYRINKQRNRRLLVSISDICFAAHFEAGATEFTEKYRETYEHRHVSFTSIPSQL